MGFGKNKGRYVEKYFTMCEFTKNGSQLSLEKYFVKSTFTICSLIFINKLYSSTLQCEKVVKNTITVFIEKSTFFRQINGFTKEVAKKLISRKFLSVIAF